MNDKHDPTTGRFAPKYASTYLQPITIEITANPRGTVLAPAHATARIVSDVNRAARGAIKHLAVAFTKLPQEHFNGLRSIQVGNHGTIVRDFEPSTKNKRTAALIKAAITDLQRRFSSEGGALTGGYCWDTNDMFLIPDAAKGVETPQPYHASAGSTFISAAIHELGHCVYANGKIATSKIKAHIHNMFSARKKSGEFPTVYAASDPKEFFAEGYSLYVHKPAYLKARDPELYSMLQVSIFKGVTYKEAGMGKVA